MNGFIIVGVGGAGCHLASYLQNAIGSPAIAVNTDQKSLKKSLFTRQLLIGPKTCGGYGANVPARGRRAAEESSEDIVSILKDVRILILVVGLGGGTGTGAAPVIANLARERGIDVIAAVTLPFEIEEVRRRQALDGLRDLKETGATILIYDNAIHFAANDQAPMANILESAALTLRDVVMCHLASSDLLQD